jgi:hypothetical protein
MFAIAGDTKRKLSLPYQNVRKLLAVANASRNRPSRDCRRITLPLVKQATIQRFT